MEKAPDAFRTISEVATWLDTPAHVLRFWESRFPQIKPVKRAGGRRYYRREDMALLGGIKILLHEQGLTIRGVQKILAERGVRHVAALSAATPGMESDELIETTAAPRAGTVGAPAAPGAEAPVAASAAATTPEEAAASERPGQAGAPAQAEAPVETVTAQGQKPPEAGEAAAPRDADSQPEFAFTAPPATAPAAPASGRDRAANGGAEGGAAQAEKAEDLPPLIAARLRAGERIAPDDIAAVRALASRLSALRARMATARPGQPPAR